MDPPEAETGCGVRTTVLTTFPGEKPESETLRDLPKVTQLAREAVGIQIQIRYKVVLHAGIFCYFIFAATKVARKHIYPQDLRLQDGEQRPICLGLDSR